MWKIVHFTTSLSFDPVQNTVSVIALIDHPFFTLILNSFLIAFENYYVNILKSIVKAS